MCCPCSLQQCLSQTKPVTDGHGLYVCGSPGRCLFCHRYNFINIESLFWLWILWLLSHHCFSYRITSHLSCLWVDESPQDHTYLGTDHSTIAPPLVYNSPSPIASLHVSTLAMLSSTTTATPTEKTAGLTSSLRGKGCPLTPSVSFYWWSWLWWS